VLRLQVLQVLLQQNPKDSATLSATIQLWLEREIVFEQGLQIANAFDYLEVVGYKSNACPAYPDPVPPILTLSEPEDILILRTGSSASGKSS
jgi:hypothetical protein